MSLHIKSLHIRVSTPNGVVGTRLEFAAGLNIIHAPNTMGKSICVNAIIYGLGLEGMLSASYDPPFGSAMTEMIEVNGESTPVLASEVFLEITNGSGDKATIRRPVAGEQSTNLVSVWNGFAISEPDSVLTQRDFFVREPGAARREAGFHHWLPKYLGWELPMVPTFRDDEVPLYVECIFPFCIIEQKRGWAGFLSRVPTHYRIRDVSERSIEFLLALDTYENSVKRERLKEAQARLRTEWEQTIAAIASTAKTINGLTDGIPHDPIPSWPPEPLPRLLVLQQDEWVPIKQAMASTAAALKQLQQQPAVTGAAKTAQLELELKEAEHNLRRTNYVLNECSDDLDQQREVLANIDRRLTAIDQDLKRNKDVRKLRQFGSVLPLHITAGECPTCQQPLHDTLLSQAIDSAPMAIEDNIAFIESQKTTFQAMRKNTARLLAAKEARLEAQRIRVEQERANVRQLRQTLVGERAPAEREIRQRLQVEEWAERAVIATADFEHGLGQLRELATQWRDLLAVIKSLPDDDLSAQDETKLNALQQSLRTQLEEYRFTSLPPRSLAISRDTFRPEHERFDFEVNNSASDLIRMIWAYVSGLLEVAHAVPTNHPGLLVMDEPKQQGAHRQDLGTLLRRLARSSGHKQQVIVTSSEEDDTFGPLVIDLQARVHEFTGKILEPLTPTNAGN